MENANIYYDGAKLLSLKDINGNVPEIYICTSNRTAGKTTYFNRLLINKFLNNGEKFCILYRFIHELDDCATKFFEDVGGLYFPNHIMTSKRRANGTYHELFFDEKSCGFAIALNSADSIKKYSHLFSKCKRMLFDEFQSETNTYCPKEINKLRSVHTSIARGQGEMVRYVPLYLVGNPTSIINPYYIALGISNRLTNKVKFLRGNGFVLEQGYNENAAKAQIESAFNKAFEDNQYLSYSANGVYLNDNLAFIEKPTGNSRYVCTLRFDGVDYGVREYSDKGIIYCDDKPDNTFATRISVTTADHRINYIMLRRNDMLLAHMRFLFERGCFRFKNLKCKEVILNALSY